MPEPAKKPRAIARRRRVQGFKRCQVLKMLAVMEPQETSIDAANAHTAEFLSTGRTGRRNAMPDILGEHAVVSSGDLPNRMQGLTTSDGAGPSTAATTSAGGASTSGAEATTSTQPGAAS